MLWALFPGASPLHFSEKGKKLHLAGKSRQQEFPSARTALCPPPAGDSLLSHMSEHLPFAETS